MESLGKNEVLLHKIENNCNHIDCRNKSLHKCKHIDIDIESHSNQFPSFSNFSNLESFNTIKLSEQIDFDQIRNNNDVIELPDTYHSNNAISLSFTSNVTYKNYQNLRNQFLLLFKIKYPDEFYKRIYDKKYATIFGINKSTKEMACFAVLDINQKHADILAIGVAKEFQGKKVGSSILKKVLEEFTLMGVTDVKLIVQQNNISAIKLYEKFGFDITKSLKDYYNLEDPSENQAYVMCKKLNGKKFWIFGLFKKITKAILMDS